MPRAVLAAASAASPAIFDLASSPPAAFAAASAAVRTDAIAAVFCSAVIAAAPAFSWSIVVLTAGSMAIASEAIASAAGFAGSAAGAASAAGFAGSAAGAAAGASVLASSFLPQPASVRTETDASRITNFFILTPPENDIVPLAVLYSGMWQSCSKMWQCSKIVAFAIMLIDFKKIGHRHAAAEP